MKTIESKFTRTDDFKYCFKLYLKNGDKYNSDLYNLEGITEMNKQLKANNEVFEILIQNADDTIDEFYTN
jgi:hypothetical protein